MSLRAKSHLKQKEWAKVSGSMCVYVCVSETSVIGNVVRAFLARVVCHL